MRTVFKVLITWITLLILDTSLKYAWRDDELKQPRPKRVLLLLAFVINSYITDLAIQQITIGYKKRNKITARYVTKGLIAFGLVTNSASYTISSNYQLINDLAKLGFLMLGYTQMIGLTFIATYILTKSQILTLSRKLHSISLLLATIVTVYGVYNCISDWHITEIDYKMQNFKADNFKIVFITDIHINPAIGERDIEYLIAKVNTLNPDLVLLGGDLIDMPVKEGAHILAHLRNLTPKIGVYFAPGNHDYKSDIEELVKQLNKLGVKSLMNQKVRIFGDEGWFYLSGVEDLGATNQHRLDFELALDGRVTNRETILLTHRPITADMALSKYKNINLILCGHTHGGESFPMSILIYLTNPYFAGEYDVTDSKIFVSVGAMYYNIPIRHVFKREIVVINLN